MCLVVDFLLPTDARKETFTFTNISWWALPFLNSRALLHKMEYFVRNLQIYYYNPTPWSAHQHGFLDLRKHLCADHVILAGRQMMNLVPNFECLF